MTIAVRRTATKEKHSGKVRALCGRKQSCYLLTGGIKNVGGFKESRDEELHKHDKLY